MPGMWLTDSQSMLFSIYTLISDYTILTHMTEVGVAFCSGGRYGKVLSLDCSLDSNSTEGGFFLIGGVILFFDRAMYAQWHLSTACRKG